MSTPVTLGALGERRRRDTAGARALRALPEAGKLVDVRCGSGKHLLAVVLDGPGRFLTLDLGGRRQYFDGVLTLAGIVTPDTTGAALLHLFADCPRLPVEHPVTASCRCGLVQVPWPALAADAEHARQSAHKVVRRVAAH